VANTSNVYIDCATYEHLLATVCMVLFIHIRPTVHVNVNRPRQFSSHWFF